MPRFRFEDAESDTSSSSEDDDDDDGQRYADFGWSDSDSSSRSSRRSGGGDDDECDGEGDEDEPPHAHGFVVRRGTSRYALDPKRESLEMYKYRKGYRHPFESPPSLEWNSPDLELNNAATTMAITTTPTKVLIKYANSASRRLSSSYSNKNKKPTANNDVDELGLLLSRAARTVMEEWQAQTPRSMPPPPLSSSALSLSPRTLDDNRQVQQMMQAEQRRMQAQDNEMRNALQELLNQQRELANEARAHEQRVQDEEEEQQKKHHKQQQQQELEQAQRAKEDEANAYQREIAARDVNEKERQDRVHAEQERRQRAAQQTTAAAEAVKEEEYVMKARKLVTQLVQVQASVEPFEKSNAVAKRRLQMKKIVNGRVNTLAENVDKIRSVAREVSQAIAEAKEQDEQMKAQIQQGNQELSSELARGKRYLIDLLCSKVIVRVQADGFNGQRGDGFPLANMLGLISVDHRELGPVLAAHIYTVCPTAIPTLPVMTSDASEDEFMKALGMIKGADGEFESFEKFLSRTEGIISILADIMSSQPNDHVLLGGHDGAVTWLSRFLSLLPEAPQTPLPLITAPVLESFLKGAGHMLAHIHADEFRKHLSQISNDIVNRLDEGPVGKPASIRLRKVVEGGFDEFLRRMPSRALPELYNNPTRQSVGSGSLFQAQRAAPSFGINRSSTQQPFSSGGNTSSNGPFTNTKLQGSSSSQRPPCRYFAEGRCRNGDNCQFSHEIPPNESSPRPTSFDGRQQISNRSNPFGGSSSTASFPFASGAANNASFGSAAPTHNSIGMSMATEAAPAPSLYGNSNAAMSAPFGSAVASPAPFGQSFTPAPAASSNVSFGTLPLPASNPFNSAPAPFGSMMPSSWSRGGPNQTSSTNASSGSSPFGAFSTGSPGLVSGQSPLMGSSSTPFGNGGFGSGGFGSVAPASTPFGNSPAPGPAPFGAAGSNPMPFGTVNATPFGATSKVSPFGAPTTKATPFGAPTTISSPFMGTTPAAFGAAPATHPFGAPASNPSPFGAPAANPSFFGGPPPAANPSPFGASPSSNPSPFAAPPGSSFGNAAVQTNSGHQSTPFGGGTGDDPRPPCRFFAQGKCHFGQNCRFSHQNSQAPGSGFGGNTFSGSTPFGGPRR